MNQLNFNNVKKQYLTVTLADEKNTVLMIGTPTKAIMDDLVVLSSTLNDMNDGDQSSDNMENLYNACARVMSRNKTGTVITREFIGELFDVEDIIIFFNAYMQFVNEVTSVKN